MRLLSLLALACGLSLLFGPPLLGPPPALAETLSLRLDPATPWAIRACGEHTLRVVPVSESTGLSESPGPSEATTAAGAITAPLGETIDLEVPSGALELRFEARDCWAPERRFVVEPGGSFALRLPVWPTADLRARLDLPRGATPPERVRLRFAPSFEVDAPETEPTGQVLCPVAGDGSLRCAPPTGELDLRFSLEGYAPVYRWSFDARQRGPHDLGTLPLVPGGSLVGWLGRGDGARLATDAVAVTLVPRGLADPRSLGETLRRRFAVVEGTVLESGFFQFDSLDPGEYRLSAEAPGFARVDLPVTVVAGRESNLRDPVLLHPPRPVAFVVDPPVDWNGDPWSLVIQRIDENRSFGETVLESPVPPDGWLDVTGLEPSLHLVQILTAGGDQMGSRFVDLAEAPSPVQLEVTAVPVTGTVRLGDEPLHATLWYGSRFGSEKVRVATDEEGVYEAVLPRAGRWLVEIEAEDPPVQRKLAPVEVPEPEGSEVVTVDLELPATKLSGTVRQNGAVPSSPTRVYALVGVRNLGTSQRIDEEGRFEFQGLEPGRLQLHAWSRDGRSPTVLVDLPEEGERVVDLELVPEVTVSGVVTGQEGPVPGARLMVQLAHAPTTPIPDVTADGGGRFSFGVPEDAREVFLTYYSLGRTASASRHRVDPDRELVLHLPAEGGSIEYMVPEEASDRMFSDSRLMVSRNGAPFVHGTLGMWAALHRSSDADSETFTAPRMAPGQYEVCIVPVEQYLPWLLGQRDPRRCRGGQLTLHGTLEFTSWPGLDDEETGQR